MMKSRSIVCLLAFVAVTLLGTAQSAPGRVRRPGATQTGSLRRLPASSQSTVAFAFKKKAPPPPPKKSTNLPKAAILFTIGVVVGFIFPSTVGLEASPEESTRQREVVKAWLEAVEES
uniref:Transmembrane protein n=1 Tax=Chromera velia CCMP2878 TaxID=1169474 RepID=A0A0G4HWR7_9ALVE|eukprot:Cvel_32793.t1-p1 / transcript=Cvel_32793.t1 / gene=Cvel_32793 / organism=Chromera_velia_CCMP2878 / gene_product=hypothetical protein / transcript_product=hypothetical protein / location=Cvel_scaffold5183:4543-4893(+) / protein_length=117 / sequence_SO=supercontig / SO=protein_coding / is_pseudo=false